MRKIFLSALFLFAFLFGFLLASRQHLQPNAVNFGVCAILCVLVVSLLLLLFCTRYFYRRSRRLEAVLARLPLQLFVVDAKGKIRFSRFTEKKFLRVESLDALPPTAAEPFRRWARTVSPEGGPRAFEFTLDGRRRLG